MPTWGATTRGCLSANETQPCCPSGVESVLLASCRIALQLLRKIREPWLSVCVETVYVEAVYVGAVDIKTVYVENPTARVTARVVVR